MTARSKKRVVKKTPKPSRSSADGGRNGGGGGRVMKFHRGNSIKSNTVRDYYSRKSATSFSPQPNLRRALAKALVERAGIISSLFFAYFHYLLDCNLPTARHSNGYHYYLVVVEFLSFRQKPLIYFIFFICSFIFISAYRCIYIPYLTIPFAF